MKQFEQITLGACYYPEHWEKRLWEEDLVRMQAAGIRFIRIAEFAWSKFEVSEGVFDFSFFDDYLNLVEKTDMKVIFCTPTATPPAWLTEKYPEVLCVEYTGDQHKHGMRRQYNYNSPVYIEKTKQIVKAVAEHYGRRKSIIGWQIDNELNCVTDEFYSEADHTAFREYVKERYQTLDAVNEAWGTVFWNQTYTQWSEIFLPRFAPRKTANPHLRLDSIRFFSESANRYCKMQADILRNYIPDNVFVTTNGAFKHLDYKKTVRDSLDFLAYDSYPTFGLMDQENEFGDRKWSMNLARIRAYSGEFGIMEQQSGPGGWVNHHKAPTPKPGQIRLWTFQSIAHGADFVSYFRWRTCTFGTEIYWYGILDHDNRNNRRLEEIGGISCDLNQLTEVAGSRYKADIAILCNFENEWDSEYDVWWGPLNQYSQTGWFQGLQKSHVPFDYFVADQNTVLEELKKYSYIILPHIPMVNQQMVNLLKQYVYQGGNLIAGARTGYKDEFGKCIMKPQPVDMNDLFGITVDDFTLLREGEKNRWGIWEDQPIELNLFHEVLVPISADCKVKAVYQDDYYAATAAITEQDYGQGKAYYVGAAFSTSTVKTLLHILHMEEPYKDKIKIPEMCELAVRAKDGIEYAFILNYSSQRQEIYCTGIYYDMLKKQNVSGTVFLEAYQVIILKMQ